MVFFCFPLSFSRRERGVEGDEEDEERGEMSSSGW